MKIINRKLLVLVALTAFAGSALIAPAFASAKAHKVSITVKKANPQVGTTISATYTSKLLGDCKMKGKLVIPDTQQTITCKGGSFYLVAHSKSAGVNANGTWKASKGKGKFKGMKGSGKFAGSLTTNKFTYSGTLNY